MNNWKVINKINLTDLRETRKGLHQAVQIVSAFPRNLLSHDATDGTASLTWNPRISGLESLPFSTTQGAVKVVLSFNSCSLQLHLNNIVKDSFVMKHHSLNQGLQWLKTKASQIGIDPYKINLELPYEIEQYDHDQLLKVNDAALQVYRALYHNSHLLLKCLVVEKWEEAFDIRCWPHHFDLATLIPLEKNEEGDILKSIGVGFSPGDEGIEEPYFYANIWPSVSYDSLAAKPLEIGKWNKHGWSGAVMSYSGFVESDQSELLESFINQAMERLIVS
jgi:hypothetical protein